MVAGLPHAALGSARIGPPFGRDAPKPFSVFTIDLVRLDEVPQPDGRGETGAVARFLPGVHVANDRLGLHPPIALRVHAPFGHLAWEGAAVRSEDAPDIGARRSYRFADDRGHSARHRPSARVTVGELGRLGHQPGGLDIVAPGDVVVHGIPIAIEVEAQAGLPRENPAREDLEERGERSADGALARCAIQVRQGLEYVEVRVHRLVTADVHLAKGEPNRLFPISVASLEVAAALPIAGYALEQIVGLQGELEGCSFAGRTIELGEGVDREGLSVDELDVGGRLARRSLHRPPEAAGLGVGLRPPQVVVGGSRGVEVLALRVAHVGRRVGPEEARMHDQALRRGGVEAAVVAHEPVEAAAVVIDERQPEGQDVRLEFGAHARREAVEGAEVGSLVDFRYGHANLPLLHPRLDPIVE